MIINGRKIAKVLNLRTVRQVTKLATHDLIPKLVIILVGNNSASLLYVRMKERTTKQLKIRPVIVHLSNQIDQSQLIRLIMQYNQDSTVDGILIQSPLPNRINERIIDGRIKPKKDVDGFNPVNIGRLFLDENGFYPVSCASRGVMTLLNQYRVHLKNRRIVIIGTNPIVCRPLLGLMINAGANVSMVRKNFDDISEYTKSADVIISDVGQVNLINGSMVKPGCTIIDVSNNHNATGKLVGDVDFTSVKNVAGKITPVPGGVGPMIIATLMQQTVELCELHHGLLKR